MICEVSYYLYASFYNIFFAIDSFSFYGVF